MIYFQKFCTLLACAGMMLPLSSCKENAPDPELNVSPESFEVGSAGETVVVNVMTNQGEWDFSFSNPSVSEWCVAQKKETALELAVSPNNTIESRSFIVNVTSGELSRSVSVTQSAAPQAIRLSIPDFSNSDSAEGQANSLVYDVKAGDKTVARICNEYVPDYSNKTRATVVYPVNGGVIDYASGFVADNGGTLVWNGESYTYSAGSKDALKELFIIDNQIFPEAVAYSVVNDAELEQFVLSDNAGTKYPLVKVGTQYWMRGNLSTKSYVDGTPIPTNLSAADWAATTAGACCISDYADANDASETALKYIKKYGVLYNWYAVTDSRGLAPEGSHVPSVDEWGKYYEFVGGQKTFGAAGSSYLKRSGMIALQPGTRDLKGKFCDRSEYGYWWSASKYSGEDAGQYPNHANHAMLGVTFDEDTYDEINFFTVWGYAPYREAYSVRLVLD